MNKDKVLTIIEQYIVLKKSAIKSYFPKVDTIVFNDILTYLTRTGIMRKEKINGVYYYHHIKYTPKLIPLKLKDNSTNDINNCFLVLCSLKKYYKIHMHNLCRYPATIKCLIEDNGKKKNCEIINLKNGEEKNIGFLLNDKIYNSKYQVARIVVVNNEYYIHNPKLISDNIDNVISIAFLKPDDSIEYYSV